jgi:uncharacterized protein
MRHHDIAAFVDHPTSIDTACPKMILLVAHQEARDANTSCRQADADD